jgi:uncharacterized membrane protein YphA (DoxX/SURF4 family)
MERDPRQYSRLLVLGGLLPFLLLDRTVGLPTRLFVGSSGTVLLAAAGVHAVGDQPRAAAGWLILAVSVGLFAVVDVAARPSYVVAFLVLLAAGFLLLASEGVIGGADGDTDGDGDEEGDGNGDESGAEDAN